MSSIHSGLQIIPLSTGIELEATIDLPKHDTMPNQWLVMCHPHPLFEGTMNNKVVTTTCRTFLQMGLATIRFNFRGVGKTTGVFSEGVGEAEDTVSLLDWLAEKVPNVKIWLGGFSFGAYVAYRTSSHYDIMQLLTINPGVREDNFADLPEPRCPWTILQGDADEVIEPQVVYQMLSRIKTGYTLHKCHDVDHFWNHRLVELKRVLLSHYEYQVKAAT